MGICWYIGEITFVFFHWKCGVHGGFIAMFLSVFFRSLALKFLWIFKKKNADPWEPDPENPNLRDAFWSFHFYWSDWFSCTKEMWNLGSEQLWESGRPCGFALWSPYSEASQPTSGQLVSSDSRFIFLGEKIRVAQFLINPVHTTGEFPNVESECSFQKGKWIPGCPTPLVIFVNIHRTWWDF